MRKIVVTDANVFVIFHQCSLLHVLIDSKHLEIYIPEEVFNEVTDNKRRIYREFYDLSEALIKARFGSPTQIIVKNVATDITDINALGVLIELIEDSDLNKGEIEAIPLAIDIKADFISGDEDAIYELNSTYAKMGSVGKSIEVFINELKQQQIIGLDDFKKLISLLKNN